MPNDCYNSVEVRADSTHDLTSFLSAVAGANGPLDFEKIAPVPAIFENLHHGKRMIDGQKVSYWYAESDLGDNLTNVRRLLDHEWQALARTEVDSEYCWRCKNWGTKWSPYDMEHDSGDRTACYSFYTAWNPPVPIVETMRARFPRLTFTAYFDEPGMQIAGFY
jgi:Ferredoxin-like domain in Api92-like protein